MGVWRGDFGVGGIFDSSFEDPLRFPMLWYFPERRIFEVRLFVSCGSRVNKKQHGIEHQSIPVAV